MATSRYSTNALTPFKADTIGLRALSVTEIQFRCKAVDQFDGVELCNVTNAVRNACVGMSSAFDSPEEGATESFHDEGPVTPHRAHVSDIISNMEKSMDGERAKGKSST